MSQELNDKIKEADLDIKRAHADLLEAQTRTEDSRRYQIDAETDQIKEQIAILKKKS